MYCKETYFRGSRCIVRRHTSEVVSVKCTVKRHTSEVVSVQCIVRWQTLEVVSVRLLMGTYLVSMLIVFP